MNTVNCRNGKTLKDFPPGTGEHNIRVSLLDSVCESDQGWGYKPFGSIGILKYYNADATYKFESKTKRVIKIQSVKALILWNNDVEPCLYSDLNPASILYNCK